MMKNKRFKHIAIFWILVRTKLVRTLKTRSRPPEVFLGKSVLKICNKFTGEHQCRSATSIKVLCKIILKLVILNLEQQEKYQCKFNNIKLKNVRGDYSSAFIVAFVRYFQLRFRKLCR